LEIDKDVIYKSVTKNVMLILNMNVKPTIAFHFGDRNVGVI